VAKLLKTKQLLELPLSIKDKYLDGRANTRRQAARTEVNVVIDELFFYCRDEPSGHLFENNEQHPLAYFDNFWVF
jgi:hypothetical protein